MNTTHEHSPDHSDVRHAHEQVVRDRARLDSALKDLESKVIVTRAAWNRTLYRAQAPVRIARAYPIQTAAGCLTVGFLMGFLYSSRQIRRKSSMSRTQGSHDDWGISDDEDVMGAAV